MERARIFGGVLGLGTLLSAFLLPFSSIAEGPGGPVDSLLAMFKLFVTTLPRIQAVGLTQLSELAYIYMTAFVVLVAAGVIGAYTKWSAFLTVVGMLVITVSPFGIFNSYTFGTSNYGVGFYAMWGIAVALVFAAFWSWKGMKSVTPAATAP